MISALILLPLAGALLMSLAPEKFARALALGCNALTALWAVVLWRNFDPGAAGFLDLVRELRIIDLVVRRLADVHVLGDDVLHVGVGRDAQLAQLILSLLV